MNISVETDQFKPRTTLLRSPTSSKPNRSATVQNALVQTAGVDDHLHEPHWYLPLIGVDPARQRKGYGSMLLAHALRACGATGTPAYLESSNPENIPLYQRHGFKVLETIQVGTSPPVIPMLRHPHGKVARKHRS
ncbi:GNAT family N-acetyltransferase [Microvirga pakistanensis]|uniref:GNAT family N-acetyltransferase n=1 Tax=Microvirga pakistanensis TaxID=1682650 RepID=UPI0024531943|nr:GNAT family N-acetyltransferase [Microvirga pakistanensis]